MSPDPAPIAAETGVRPEQVQRTLGLHAEGATVPFIARYRKEATGGLDEVQIQAVLDAARRHVELEERRAAVVDSISSQGRMTDELARALAAATTRSEIEDLYLPYRPKRRTRASMARERGLEPLAELVWRQEKGDAARFVSDEKGVPDVAAAMAGARDICAERVSEDADLRGLARRLCGPRAELESDVVPERKGEPTKFEAWYGHREPVSRIPSHRALAVLRGEAECVLRVRVALPDEDVLSALRKRVVRRPGGPFAEDLEAAVDDGWRRLLAPSLEGELRREMKQRADAGAIDVFARNLRSLLLTAPAGARVVLALDPGLRTGIKAAALDGTGRLLETATLYTERGAAARERALDECAGLLARHGVELIAVGNGTGSREAEAFCRDVQDRAGTSVPIVSVSEQGASVYSASELAREEFGQLDVSLRGAVSIGRRLQDPLAELVKIDPKSIGVGQYQHDVEQGALRGRLDEVVDSCVNQVGVDVNTASPQLLAHVSGIGERLAGRIVTHRDAHGPFPDRASLRKVDGLGPKAFEQAAGFCRVRGGDPLDDSAVHPERYAVVQRMARDLGVGVRALVGEAATVARIDWRRYVDGELGRPTLVDILGELAKPGRDPRGDFTPPAYRDDVRRLEDVKEGMVLEGVVTNVTAFGAFVDVGVHQDGLVHISRLADRFVRDPAEVVTVGDRVTVSVVGVDVGRRRLALSMRT